MPEEKTPKTARPRDIESIKTMDQQAKQLQPDGPGAQLLARKRARLVEKIGYDPSV